ncbi:MAG: hypothetical protein HYT22_03555 [Candidatus Niyogibacteria bacterium]|nr:hypothetical protein [Candidatus Niyogibacteria bacterium]
MSFPVEIKKLPKSEVEIAGEVLAADFDRAITRSTKEWNEKVELPGFRSGNIPEKILIEKVGETAILERAAELALSEAYPKILDEHKIDAIGHPKVTITKLARNNPLGFKAVTAVVPEVGLPDYKALAHGLAAKKEMVAVEEKEITDALEYLRSAHSVKKGETEEKLALDDAFAQKIGQKTMDDLKKLLSENIRRDKVEKAKDKQRMEIMDAIAARSAIALPDILIEGEKEKMLSELKGSLAQMALPWDDYLKHIKKSEEDLRKEWSDEAEKRVRFGLVLRAIADQEKIDPSETEITAEADTMLERYPEADRAKIDKARLAGYAYGMLRNEKVFELLENA